MIRADVHDVPLSRAQRNALIVGIVALLICIVIAIFFPRQFFRSYLLAYVFWIGIALGSLGISLMHNLTGGRWGALIRRFLVSARRTLPVMALLAIPILAGIPMLYEWSHPEVVAHDAVLQQKQVYLNIPFFIARTVVYFIIWIGISLLLGRRETPGPASTPVKAISGPGLIIFVFTVTFAAVDWIMTLEPHWFSTIYGAIFVVGQVLQTLAFCVALLALWANRRPFSEILEPTLFHDLGNLLLAFTVLWAYTSFSQFLIIWSGNIPEEAVWYLRRSHNGWQFIGLILIVFHFFVPFAVLLSRRVKKTGRALARLSVAIIVMRLVDLFYWIGPAFEDHSLGTVAMDVLAVIALGGLWLWVFLWQLRRGPLVNVDDPRLQPAEAGH
jgi:hypothetical protein